MSEIDRETSVPHRPSGVATIKDVAAALGISHSSVSRALRGHGRISQELRERVQDTAQALGYVPHSGARSMRASTSTIIGFVAPDIGNAFYSTAARLLSDQCSDRGYQLMLAVSEDDAQRELRQVEALREARASAIVITPTAGLLERTARLLEGTQVIQFVRRNARLDAASICVDDVAGTGLATRHLLDLGHRRIAYVGGDRTLSTGRARLEGYLTTLAAYGLKEDASLICLGPPRPEFGTIAVAGLLKEARRPTGLVLGSSHLILGALSAFRAERLSLPEDISLVGYGDPDWFAAWNPGMTTVDFSVETMMGLAISRMFDSDGGSLPGETPVSLTVRPHLIVRGSTAVPPGA